MSLMTFHPGLFVRMLAVQVGAFDGMAGQEIGTSYGAPEPCVIRRIPGWTGPIRMLRMAAQK